MPIKSNAAHLDDLAADVNEVPMPHMVPEEGEDATADALDVQSTLQGLIQEAVDNYEDNIEPDQVLATDYYYGRPFGDEKKGRSQVVSTDLRDAVLDRVPDLLEIFTGSDSVVEFRPLGPEDVPVAQQQTDYVNYLFYEDNDGFLILNAVFKDSDVRRLGFIKWGFEETSRVEGEPYTGMTEEELTVLLEDEEYDVEVEITHEYTGEVPIQDPQTGETVMVEVPLYDAEVKRTLRDGRVVIKAVPPEEVAWSPGARDFDTAQVVIHSREVPRDELTMMGIPEDVIEANAGRRERTGSSASLDWARQFYANGKVTTSRTRTEAENDAQEPVLFTEAYALMDADGDGIAELRMFQCIGPDFTVNPEMPMGELIDMVPLAAFTPEPEPHTIPGLCMFDHAKEIQRVKSQVQRAQLNSLAQAVEPQLAIADGVVNVGDLLNPEVTGFVRVKRGGDVNNSIREIKTSFVGAETLEVLRYYDTLKGDRTGQAGPREGLDPNILQSTTPEAVNSSLSKGQRRIKMTARVYAETGMKRLFRGVLRTLVQHKPRARMVRLRNEWVNIDPRSWTADRDLKVNVALGTGSRQEKIAELMALAEKQEAHIQMGSPLVTMVELRKTYARLTDLLGYKDTAEFFRPWTEEQQAQMEQAQSQQPQQPDPAMVIAEAEAMKIQAQIQMEQQKMQLEQWKAQREDDRERDKQAQDAALKEREIEAKHQVNILDTQLKAQVAQNRAAMEADVKREQTQAPTPEQ